MTSNVAARQHGPLTPGGTMLNLLASFCLRADGSGRSTCISPTLYCLGQRYTSICWLAYQDAREKLVYSTRSLGLHYWTNGNSSLIQRHPSVTRLVQHVKNLRNTYLKKRYASIFGCEAIGACVKSSSHRYNLKVETKQRHPLGIHYPFKQVLGAHYMLEKSFFKNMHYIGGSVLQPKWKQH